MSKVPALYVEDLGFTSWHHTWFPQYSQNGNKKRRVTVFSNATTSSLPLSRRDLLKGATKL